MKDAESEGPWESCDSFQGLPRQDALDQMELWLREGGSLKA